MHLGINSIHEATMTIAGMVGNIPSVKLRPLFGCEGVNILRTSCLTGLKFSLTIASFSG